MFTFDEKTTLIGVSELRLGIDKILKKARKGLVIIEKRHKPKAVLMSKEEYDHMQELLETAEDIVLGFTAQKRYEKSADKDYLDIRELL